VDQLFDGRAAPLVLQLMRKERFSRDEIEQLQRLIDQLDGQAK
jgi:predicted transcriptional regulator